ncbi:MAG: aminoacetone oxidase family FAD-binding enzyme [Planctomycetes bacterium]|nr:aminoacetone oxidase family FAD-binding enzyme [Planctomycetota bacterium]
MRARMERENEIVVVGAGAAGLWAAWRAAELGRRVLLVEKTPRAGTKILASGGTHCNLTTTLDARAAAELFGPDGARFLAPAFRALPPALVREQFHALGVETVEAPLEKIFPKSGRARDVRDALERAARERGVEFVFDASVARVVPRGARAAHAVTSSSAPSNAPAHGPATAAKAATISSSSASAEGWRVELADGTALDAERVVLAPGGRSYAKSGTTGDGYAWLAELDLSVIEPAPALVPLESDAPWVHALAGIALPDVEAKLVDAEGRAHGRRRRPVLFTHKGVSGPGAMDVSAPVGRAEVLARRRGQRCPPFQLLVDLAPDLDREALRALLIEGASRPGAPSLARVLPFDVPKRVLERVALQAKLPAGELRLNGLDKARRHALVEALKAFALPISGTTGFDHAEVTAGGLALSHLDKGTMEVKGRPGLFVCGELLDLQGPIGGLNFQAAFATAELAARALAR